MRGEMRSWICVYSVALSHTNKIHASTASATENHRRRLEHRIVARWLTFRPAVRPVRLVACHLGHAR